MNLSTLKKHTIRVEQILKWIEEDPSIALLFNGNTPTIQQRKLKNTGFKAQVLRALNNRTLTEGQLRGISRMDVTTFNKNIAYLYKLELIKVEGKNLILTDSGKKEAQYYIDNPNAKAHRG